MNSLLKYILIVNLVSVILIGLFAVGSVMYENYKETYYTQSQVDAAQQGGQLLAPPKGILYSLGNVLAFLFMFVLPAFIVLMSGIYQYKNPNFKGYGKSLLIPLSYVILAFVLTLLIGQLTINLSGEEGMIFIYIWAQFMLTFVTVAIVNLVICLIKRD
jgi:hypothetical protein